MIANNIEASLKSHETIEVVVYKTYTLCEETYFSLYENNKFLKKLPIISKSESKSSFIYTLKVDFEFIIGHEYTIYDYKLEKTSLNIAILAKEKKFEEKFRYDGELGAIYSNDHTIFRLFSPFATEVYVKIIKENVEIYPMHRLDTGVFEANLCGDFDGAPYLFVAKLFGNFVEDVDPYAFGLNDNSSLGYVINKEKVKQIHLFDENLRPLSPTESVIYELDVRDFTSKLDNKFSGTYKLLGQKELKTIDGLPAGIDYIKQLGITHVQLLPIYDFQTIDDNDIKNTYNWGYDPKFYFAPEGSYSTNPNDAYARIFELRQLVANFHQVGIKVNMDVVFNHTFNRLSNSLERLCPNYYYRFSQDGTPSNGSFCGNDIESTSYMARKMIIDCLKHFVDWYGIDGYRFDLMGILDIETINLANKVLKEMKPDLFIYGEGWDMPTSLGGFLKATMYNQKSLPEIGFFNDRFRETIKGKTGESEFNIPGYALGDINYIDGFKHCFLGSSIAISLPPLFESPKQSINYVECHDNATLYDKIKNCFPDEDEAIILKQLALTNIITILSFGVPFIHAGQEIGLTKYNKHNTYDAGDKYNGFDYSILTKRKDTLKLFKDVVKLRKSYSCFTMSNKEEILNNVTFENLVSGAILIKIKKDDKMFYLFINPSKDVIHYELPSYGKVIFNNAGFIAGEFYSKFVMINSYSVFFYEINNEKEVK